jgi:chemotaxis protein CheD
MTTKIRRIFLLQGEVFCERGAAVVTTILGSCVSVCLWDPMLKLGGINHYVLPESGRNEDNPRYGTAAIESLRNKMIDLGSRPRQLQAKIFGGAAVLPLGLDATTVGSRNVEIALQCLQDFRIPVLARHTGGQYGRVISFYTETGETIVRELGPDAAPADRLPEAAR